MLGAPAGSATRPTAQPVREALFNIIAAEVVGSAFVDLFAGSGAVGVEALSRGAATVVFAENEGTRLRVIRDNLRLVGAREQEWLVMNTDLTRDLPLRAVGSCVKKRADADCVCIIFADPPYSFENLAALPARISDSFAFRNELTLIIEHYKKTGLPQNTGGLTLYNEKKYGDTLLSFYRRAETGE